MPVTKSAESMPEIDADLTHKGAQTSRRRSIRISDVDKEARWVTTASTDSRTDFMANRDADSITVVDTGRRAVVALSRQAHRPLPHQI